MNYYLTTSTKKRIAVGATRPVYDQKKKGWVTDVGVFATKNPGAYAIEAVLTEQLPVGTSPSMTA